MSNPTDSTVDTGTYSTYTCTQDIQTQCLNSEITQHVKRGDGKTAGGTK